MFSLFTAPSVKSDGAQAGEVEVLGRRAHSFIFRHADTPWFMLSMDMKFVDANDIFLTDLNVDRSVITGMTLSNVVPEEYYSNAVEALSAVLRNAHQTVEVPGFKLILGHNGNVVERDFVFWSSALDYADVAAGTSNRFTAQYIVAVQLSGGNLHPGPLSASSGDGAAALLGLGDITGITAQISASSAALSNSPANSQGSTARNGSTRTPGLDNGMATDEADSEQPQSAGTSAVIMPGAARDQPVSVPPPLESS